MFDILCFETLCTTSPNHSSMKRPQLKKMRTDDIDFIWKQQLPTQTNDDGKVTKYLHYYSWLNTVFPRF
jgi:hypothetical protein